MSVYETLCKLSEIHEKIVGGGYTDFLVINLEKRTIRSKGKYIFKDGVMQANTIETTERTYDLTGDLLPEKYKKIDPYVVVENLYINYINSYPSKRSSKGCRTYFRPKSIEELTDEELENGMDRVKARYELELYILFASEMGLFTWENTKHWFWNSKVVPSLVLYKSWLIKEEER